MATDVHARGSHMAAGPTLAIALGVALCAGLYFAHKKFPTLLHAVGGLIIWIALAGAAAGVLETIGLVDGEYFVLTTVAIGAARIAIGVLVSYWKSKKAR